MDVLVTVVVVIEKVVEIFPITVSVEGGNLFSRGPRDGQAQAGVYGSAILLGSR